MRRQHRQCSGHVLQAQAAVLARYDQHIQRRLQAGRIDLQRLLQARSRRRDVVDALAGSGGGAADRAQAGLRGPRIQACSDQLADRTLQFARALVGAAGFGKDGLAQCRDLRAGQVGGVADGLVLACEAGGVLHRFGQRGDGAAEHAARIAECRAQLLALFQIRGALVFDPLQRLLGSAQRIGLGTHADELVARPAHEIELALELVGFISEAFQAIVAEGQCVLQRPGNRAADRDRCRLNVTRHVPAILYPPDELRHPQRHDLAQAPAGMAGQGERSLPDLRQGQVVKSATPACRRA